MAVGFDTVAVDYAAASSSLNVAVTIAANSDRALAVLVAFRDTGTVTVSSISGGSATWSSFATGNGNGNIRGEIWVGKAPASGAQTVAITMSAAPSNELIAHVFSLYNVDQTTPLSSSQFTTTGNCVVTVASGDMAVSNHVDTAINRTVSGCTTTTDESAFEIIGHSAAHCTGSPTSTFTWSGFGTQSLAMGVNVQQVSAGGGTAGPRIARGTLRPNAFAPGLAR